MLHVTEKTLKTSADNHQLYCRLHNLYVIADFEYMISLKYYTKEQNKFKKIKIKIEEAKSGL